MQLEKYASEVFTRNTFAMVHDEIKSEARLSISNYVHDTTFETYTFKKFGGDDTTWTVTYRCGEQNFECSCKLFDTAGIPCCHYFGVMKSRNIHQITETLIYPRWTTNAKDDFTMEVSNNSTPTHIIQIARYGALSARANRMCYLASKSTEGYKDAKVTIDNLTIQMQGLLTASSIENKGKLPIHDIALHVHVKDPILATTKGGVRQGKKSGGKTRHCGRCRQPEHTTKTCIAYAHHNFSAIGSNQVSFKITESFAPSFDTSHSQHPKIDCMMDSVAQSQTFLFQCNVGSTLQYNLMRNRDVSEVSDINASIYMQHNRWWGPTHFI
ncbi:hypothetical protein Ddye_000746 [Dipteronia dyeriana]|uniref:Protein FAR1-RELATED SEQUENCE n=1 Tax=Dipteronia dyeriana TaxID=168575 RepID=A0AAE0CSU3_9ROSI|nr:hypothetical protein Ddye_000746 [Dipteronia dyeriana]